MAFGAEYRRDGYGIEEGEEASYVNGGVLVLDGPQAGQLAAVGAQVFPGFRPRTPRTCRATAARRTWTWRSPPCAGCF